MRGMNQSQAATGISRKRILRKDLGSNSMRRFASATIRGTNWSMQCQGQDGELESCVKELVAHYTAPFVLVFCSEHSFESRTAR